jgi:hypothetical protein
VISAALEVLVDVEDVDEVVKVGVETLVTVEVDVERTVETDVTVTPWLISDVVVLVVVAVAVELLSRVSVDVISEVLVTVEVAVTGCWTVSVVVLVFPSPGTTNARLKPNAKNTTATMIKPFGMSSMSKLHH